eukprot:scaffold242289_cov31-Tisochrysis_lutea.AAC.1
MQALTRRRRHSAYCSSCRARLLFPARPFFGAALQSMRARRLALQSHPRRSAPHHRAQQFAAEIRAPPHYIREWRARAQHGYVELRQSAGGALRMSGLPR